MLQSQFSIRILVLLNFVLASCLSNVFSQENTSKAIPEVAAKLIERAKAEDSDAWLDNGKMTFFHQVEADSVQVRIAAQSKPMKRISGSNVWTCQVSLPDLEHGMMNYGFTATLNGKQIGRAHV